MCTVANTIMEEGIAKGKLIGEAEGIAKSIKRLTKRLMKEQPSLTVEEAEAKAKDMLEDIEE